MLIWILWDELKVHLTQMTSIFFNNNNLLEKRLVGTIGMLPKCTTVCSFPFMQVCINFMCLVKGVYLSHYLTIFHTNKKNVVCLVKEGERGKRGGGGGVCALYKKFSI